MRTRDPRPFVLALAVFLVTCVVFWPALDGAWLDWDDVPLLVEKQEWRGLSDAHLRWMFSTFHMGPYQPLSWMSYAVDHALWGMEPRGYHLTNVVLHAATAAFVVLCARRLFAAAGLRAGSWSFELGAAATALLWSIHPLRVESVAWITERRDCLSGLFFVLALHAWLAHARGGRRRSGWYWLAFASFAASLLAKGLGLVLPLLFLVLDVWPLRRFDRAALLEKWPFLALSGLFGVLAIVGQRVTGAVVESAYHGTVARIVQSLYGLAFYVRKTLWPSDLMVFYPMKVPLDPSEPRFVYSMAAVGVALVALVLARRRVPALVAAVACYVLLVGPVLGLFQVGSQLVADRYAYQSTLPLVLCIGGALVLFAQRIPPARALALLSIVFAAVLVPLALATRAQIAVWRDTDSLWRHDLAIDPADNPARRNLIVAYLDRGRAATDPAERAANFARALEECRRGAEQFPDAAYMLNAAKVYDLMASDAPDERQRYLELALEEGRRGVELAERTIQRFPAIYESVGVTLCKLGRAPEAIRAFERFVELDPRNAKAYGMLGEALMQVGRTREALAQLEAGRKVAPGSALLHLDLGDAHRQLGELPQAIAAYRRVLDLKRGELGGGAAGDPEFAAARQALDELGVDR
jgi:protein O-mannosyl-transferase